MYRAPLRELQFVLDELFESAALAGYPGLADYTPELGAAVLAEAARFAETVLDPLNRPGDERGATWTAEGVRTPEGFRDAYRQFMEGGWPQLGADPAYGGQQVPQILVTAVQEIWAASNLAFKLCPMLTHGAVHALELCGTQTQKQLFLPRMVRGEWTGTMDLTEPQAGSDLGQIRTRAVPEADHYRLFGQKIFITWGDHDYTPNIIHMVLARIDGAPAGVKGISLFIVPKVLVNPDGSLGEPNTLRCLSIEHKLGIHASPTCVLAYGDDRQGALGYLVGEPNRGLEYMFIMMNTARLSVGLEGYAVGERAFQQALDWARTRIQGRPPGTRGAERLPIIHHPDIKRMLLTMKSLTEASRAIALYGALQLDIAKHHPDEARRQSAQKRADLLIPIVKGWCTEQGNQVCGIGVQVHGGMGFIEETGAAQFVRDARITTIYEGTTGIQSNDLIGRKIGRDHGAAMNALIAEIRQELQQLPASGPVAGIRDSALGACGALQQATDSLLVALGSEPAAAMAVSVPYLMLCGYVLGSWLMAKSATLAAARSEAPEQAFYESKVHTARFFADQILPNATALACVVRGGAASVLDTPAASI